MSQCMGCTGLCQQCPEGGADPYLAFCSVTARWCEPLSQTAQPGRLRTKPVSKSCEDNQATELSCPQETLSSPDSVRSQGLTQMWSECRFLHLSCLERAEGNHRSAAAPTDSAGAKACTLTSPGTSGLPSIYTAPMHLWEASVGSLSSPPPSHPLTPEQLKAVKR